MLIFLSLIVGLLLAHDTWLLPLLEGGSRSFLCTGNRFPNGEHATRPERVASWSVLTETDHIPFSSLEQVGDKLAADFLASSDVQLIEAVLHPHPIEFDLAEFEEYLLSEDHADLRENARRISGRIREMYTKCSKAIPGSTGSQPVKTRDQSQPCRHPLELVRLAGKQFRLIAQGLPVAGGPVKAYSTRGEIVSARTDQAGIATFDLVEGEWMLRAHTIRQSDRDDADFESFWCSLTLWIGESE